MRFDFFRRANPTDEASHELPVDTAAAIGDGLPDADGFLTYAAQLDAQKRVRGLRLRWRSVAEGDAQAKFQAMLACVGREINPPKGWRLGGVVVFLDLTVQALFLAELQALPPQNVVLCMGLDDLLDPDTRSMLMFLREQGFGVMLTGADALPEDPEVCAILTHMDVGAGDADLVASVRRAHPPGSAAGAIHPIATRMDSWKDFDACAARRVDVFVEGRSGPPPVKEANATLQPESMLIVRLMQMIQRNEDMRAIEAALKHDAAITYRLLRHINSPTIGAGIEVHSLRHAVSMLGYSPLFRWLSLLLATSNKGSSPYMTKKAIVRGRVVELLGQGMLPPGDGDNLFVAGMFSLIDGLLGVSMEEVLAKVQLSEAVQQAILHRGGVYGPFLALAESCERDAEEAARLCESLFLSPSQVNAAHIAAIAWAQDVSPAEASY